MITDKMAKALNEQVGLEFESSYLYLAMSAWCESRNLPGFAHWLRVQSEEERTHAMRILDYLLDQGAEVALPALGKPRADYASVAEVFRAVVEHERKVTASIHKLQGLALELHDYATQEMLAWFVREQVEEEKNAGLMLAHLEMVGDKSAAILNLDHRAGKRGS